ncbi:ABC transporter permease [Candidatus Acetothermia bacterium]|nr:ABC transporter permease [Candidatus Acetothermia bacterium]
MSQTATLDVASKSFGRRVSSFFFKHPTLGTILLLSPPLLWLGIIYLGSLFALLIESFFSLDSFSGQVVENFTLSTYAQLLVPAHLDIILRTTVMAACVTFFSFFLAFPVAYYMARYASPRMRAFMYLAVLVPLWSSYLVRIYAWKLILAKEGIVNWFVTQLGLNSVLDALLSTPVIGGPSLSISAMGTFIVFVYIWLPFMILPIYTALERVPNTLIEASSDLGARPRMTFRNVIFPLALPGVIAGSIFTFSLTLGDFIIPQIFGNSSYFIGLAVYQNQGVAGNIPLAAAFTVVPIVVMGIYLTLAKKAGAFNAL